MWDVIVDLTFNCLVGIFNWCVLFLLDHILYIVEIVYSNIAADMLPLKSWWLFFYVLLRVVNITNQNSVQPINATKQGVSYYKVIDYELMGQIIDNNSQ